MPTATDKANGLNADYMQRLQKMQPHNRLTHTHSVDINPLTAMRTFGSTKNDLQKIFFGKVIICAFELDFLP